MVFKVKDYYFEKAKKDKYFARSAYKLEEIDQKFQVMLPGQKVLDLGYYPGAWIQYSCKKIGNNGKVVGIDIQGVNKKLSHLKNVNIFEKDIFDITTLAEFGVDTKFDTVVSDMAPSTTGVKSVDQDRSLNLVEKVFEMLPKLLKENGNFVIKVFDSHDAQLFLKTQKKFFKKFHYLRPKSTRSVSKEFFVIGIDYQA